MKRKAAFLKDLLHVQQHALADARHFQQFLGLCDQVSDLLRQRFNSLRRSAIRANAEGVLRVDLQQVGSLVEDASNGFVVHAKLKIKQIWEREPASPLWDSALPDMAERRSHLN